MTAKASRGWWKPDVGHSVEWFLEKHRKITWVRVAVAVCPTLSGQGIEKVTASDLMKAALFLCTCNE